MMRSQEALLEQAWNLDSAIKSASMTVWKYVVKYEGMKSMKIC